MVLSEQGITKSWLFLYLCTYLSGQAETLDLRSRGTSLSIQLLSKEGIMTVNKSLLGKINTGQYK